MSVTIYSKPECPQCTMTKKHLDKIGVPYTDVDVLESPGGADVVRGLGFSSLPVVVADGIKPWSGFRPDRLNGLLVPA